MTGRSLTGGMTRGVVCLLMLLLLTTAVGCHATTADVPTPQEKAAEEGFPVRALIEGGQSARAAADGTIAVWGAVRAGTEDIPSVLVVGRDLAGWTPLAVPDNVVLSSAGEILDLDGDGKQDLLIPGEDPSASSGYAAFFWSGCAPGRLPLALALSCQMSVTAPAGDRVYASSLDGQVVALWWKDGSLGETCVADLQTTAVEPFRAFRCHCLAHADVDADGSPEIILGGEAAGRGVIYLCHEHGSEGRLTSVGEVVRVTGLAAGNDGQLVFAGQSAAERNPPPPSQPAGAAPYRTSLLLGRASAGHTITMLGEAVSCPIGGEVSDASLAALGGGELVAAWHTASPSGNPQAVQGHRSSLVAYGLVAESLKETARRDLVGAWTLAGSVPASPTDRTGRILAVLAPGEAPQGMAPGVYVFDRSGPQTEKASFGVWWGAGSRVSGAGTQPPGASRADFAPLVCMEDARYGSAGSDGTVVLWNSSTVAGQSHRVSRAAVLDSDLGWPWPLVVPSGASLDAGEVLDVDVDGKADFLAVDVGASGLERGSVYLWPACEPERSPVALDVDSHLNLTVSVGAGVYATRRYNGDPVMMLSYEDGSLKIDPAVDPQALFPERLDFLAHWCLASGDVDGDDRLELVLGGYSRSAPAVLVCHEDGSGQRLTRLDEIGWVGSAAISPDDHTLVLGVCTSVLPDAAPSFSENHLSARRTRLVLANVTPEHGVALEAGRDTSCPLPSMLSDADLAFLEGGELAVAWRSGDMPQGLGGPAKWFPGGRLVTYSLGPGGLTETASLDGVSRLLDAVPSPEPGRGALLLAYLDGENLSEGWSPGVYLLERGGLKTGFRTFSITPGQEE